MRTFVTKSQALKLLKERTGKRFSIGIFSKKLSHNGSRIWAYRGSVDMVDVEAFIEARQKRRDEPKQAQIERRLRNLLLALCGHDVTMRNMEKLVADNPDAGKSLRMALHGLSWAVGGVLAARKALAVKATELAQAGTAEAQLKPSEESAAISGCALSETEK